MSNTTDRKTDIEIVGLECAKIRGAADTDGAETDEPLRVTVLGSGASSFANGRANAGHVIHVDGEPRFLLDAGGGIGARLAEANIDLTALDAVFLGHLHIDHTADLPAVVKAAYQQGRERPLPIYGPTGTDDVPGTDAFVSGLFDANTGVYNYLSSFVERYTEGELELETTEIDATIHEENEVRTVYEGDLVVEAIPETHGRMPTLAYRFDRGERSITFSGDTTLETGNLTGLADGTDVLVHNRMLDSHTDPDAQGTELHSSPTEIGVTASAADAGILVLSHISQEGRAEIERELERIRGAYNGPIVAVRDLVRIAPDGRMDGVTPVENEVLVVES
ncbi:MAG: MBL fold metallo-hydrolase [Euryarchaeota archaeon]|nr:MBL fold metallo-hydrolase [Euryarchaeota archaeon]